MMEDKRTPVLKRFSRRIRLKSQHTPKKKPELKELSFTKATHLNLHSQQSVSLQDGPMYWNGFEHRHHQSQVTMEDETWLKLIKSRTGQYEKENEINFTNFRKILQIDNNFFAERFFALLDPQTRDYVTVDELHYHLSSLTKACVCRKLKFIFDMYDIDGSGTIDRTEFSEVLTQAIDDNALAIGPQQIEQMTNEFFKSLDIDENAGITFNSLKIALEKSPDAIDNLKISASRFLRLPKALESQDAKKWDSSKFIRKCIPYCITPKYISRHPVDFFWAVFYILSIIAFFLYGSLYAVYIDHKISTTICMPFYAVAHGFGMNLNWNCMLLIIFMLRRTLTALRNSKLGPYLSCDLAVYIHKVVGWVVGICALGHFIFHMIHFRCLAKDLNANYTYNEFLFTTKPGLGWLPQAPWQTAKPGVVSVTGWPLLVFYVVIFVCSLPFVRRSGKFEIFYFTHLLYIPFMIILIVHSDKFWKFVIVPGIVFILEKLSMTRCARFMMSNKFYVKDVTLWPGVTQISLNHPPGFTFNPGDYVYINIPSIARFEWHPFTISSCPEDLDRITLHVRCAGQWTKRLHEYFRKHQLNVDGLKTVIQMTPMPEDATVKLKLADRPSVFNERRQSGKGRTVQGLQLPVYIDGSYGTPTGRIFNSEHVVLVCAGIGVTPFASILQSMLYRHRADRVQCPDCNHQWTPVNAGRHQLLKKVHFIWVVNNQKSIEWFLEVLEQLDMNQREENALDQLLDIQIYVTGAKKMDDLYSFALTSALDVFYKKHRRDLITGIQSRGIPGRPDWKTVFGKIDAEKRGPVSVFFCGPHSLSKELRFTSAQYGFQFFKEVF